MKYIFYLMMCCAIAIGDIAVAQTLSGRGTVGDSNTSEAAMIHMDNIQTVLGARMDLIQEELSKFMDCLAQGKFYRKSTDSCVDEIDPLTQPFAKAALPSCAEGEYLTSDGVGLSCLPLPEFQPGKKYSVTCVSKANRSKTVVGQGAGTALVARAPSNQSTWVVFKGGPYLNCFDGGGPPPDFNGNANCQKYAGTPGHGRSLRSCSWR